jgi:hypothetical protein
LTQIQGQLPKGLSFPLSSGQRARFENFSGELRPRLSPLQQLAAKPGVGPSSAADSLAAPYEHVVATGIRQDISWLQELDERKEGGGVGPAGPARGLLGRGFHPLILLDPSRLSGAALGVRLLDWLVVAPASWSGGQRHFRLPRSSQSLAGGATRW